jgi:perosamine synthetase
VQRLGLPKTSIVEALRAEGVEGMAAAYQNIHLLPIYQKRIAYGSKGFPWTADFCSREVDYRKGICPVAETLQDTTYIGFAMCMHEMSDDEVDLLIAAFRKVWGNLDDLRSR